MDDRLEQFIKSHRSEMDDKSPKKDLWAEIEKDISIKGNQRQILRPIVYWRAAAVILLLVSSWLVFDRINEGNESVNPSEIALTNPQLQEAESYYISLIAQKREEIKSMSEKFEVGDDFLYEIDRLDSMYTALKNDMMRGNQENLVDAMILNL